MTASLPPPPEFAYGPISCTDLVRYAGASGDFNPLHHDEAYARDAGLETVMAHGMFSAGLLASFLSAWVGDRHVRRFKVRFIAPVWPGDTLRAEGKVIRDAEASVEVALSLHRQDGIEVVTGMAEVAGEESFA